MELDRRSFTSAGLAAAAVCVADAACAAPLGSETMFGLISQILVLPEVRAELVRILAGATKAMPGCLSYIIAKDASRDDAVWVTEVWTDTGSHAALLKLPAVQEALAQGRPLITGVGTRTTTHPVAGV